MNHPRRGTTDPFTVVAPGRVNLIGEHTDYNDGFVLPMAIDRHVSLHVRARTDRVAVLRTHLMPEAVTVDLGNLAAPAGHWSAYPVGVLAGYRRLGFEPDGFEATITSTLPAGAGLSSSAALEVATAVAVETLCGRPLPPAERAVLCQHAEHDYAGVPCGIMDQFAVSLGRSGHALRIDCRSRDIIHVPLDTAARVLVFDSGVRHRLADGAYARRRSECREAADRLGVACLRDLVVSELPGHIPSLPKPLAARVRHVVTEIARVPAFVAAVEARDWTTAGRLMVESHRSLATDFEVSCPELDRIVEIALGLPGVFGCRMTGGGFGGCAIALVASDCADDVGDRLQAGYRQATGLTTEWFVTAAADGPRVVW